MRTLDGTSRDSGDRHERLVAIIQEHACSIWDRRTAHGFLAPSNLTPRFAAATSATAPDPSRPTGSSRLIVADSVTVLARLLDRERDEGRLAYGRVWDLDATWDLLGNLDARYSERVEAESSVFGVTVPGRDEGLYLFEEHHDAEDFAQAVRRHGEVALLSEELLFHRRGADALIVAEARFQNERLFRDPPFTARPTSLVIAPHRRRRRARPKKVRPNATTARAAAPQSQNQLPTGALE
jgi:hypothetical protein